MQRYLLCLSLVLLSASFATAAEDAPEIMTFPASKGEVVFNHKKHVAGYSNCKTCHDRKGGKIKGLGKEWAHKVCRGCHEAIMVGPVKCEGCHSTSVKK